MILQLFLYMIYVIRGYYQETVRYLSRYFGATQSNCGEKPAITIIQRLHRTITNVDELKEYLLESNVSKNVNIHIFENLSLQRQVRIFALFWQYWAV